MSDFINSLKPRKSALQANKETLENTNESTVVNTSSDTSVTTKEIAKNVLTNVNTIDNTKVITDNNTNVTTNKLKLSLKAKEKAELITIRIVKSRKDKIDKLAKKFNTTRQEIINKAFDFFFENLE
jgi:hypothetical protein